MLRANSVVVDRWVDDREWLRLTSFDMVGCGFWANTGACRTRNMFAASGSWCAAIVERSLARFSARSPSRRPGSCPIRSRERFSGWRRTKIGKRRPGWCEDQQPAFATCQELIARRRLQMNLVDVEMIHGRERVVFYYLAEKRVDFRELVKDLARVLRTRIEMRQIGVRDEAKLLADYGDCGKPVCCNTHLTHMPPVSMKMAKIQKTTLDPAKISGRCGRLKCCLRYEYDTYRTMEKTLPPVGSRVVTPKGPGRIVAQDILVQKLVVEFEDQRRIIVRREDILSFEAPKGRMAAQAELDDTDDSPFTHNDDAGQQSRWT